MMMMMKMKMMTMMMMMMMMSCRMTRAQNCGCAAEECCSRFGFCGTTEDFCGTGCREGPCTTPQLPPATHNVSVADIVTQPFFDAIIGQASDSGCPGKTFYSRQAFLAALDSFSRFGQVGSIDDSNREIAAFFGHVTHETGHFCHIEEINGAAGDYCDEGNTEWPCNPDKKYFGRGPIQLSWNFNYGPAGRDIGFDGLNAPETVGADPVLSFKTALWYWMNFVRPVLAEGFGATIRAINGALECNGGNEATVRRRIEFYTLYCNQLGVDPGPNLTC